MRVALSISTPARRPTKRLDGPWKSAAAPAASVGVPSEAGTPTVDGGLPRLYDNNSDKALRELLPEEKKRAYSIAQNTGRFVTTYGREKCGLFTVTFDPKDLLQEARRRGITVFAEAQRRVNNFCRRVLGSLFGEYIRVREFHRSGYPHFHFVIECKADISAGFNWEYYEAVRTWSRTKQGPKPRGDLGRSLALVELHKKLNESGPSYGIGRMELTPIRSTAEAVGYYVGGYLSKSKPNPPEEAKGTRAVAYSQGFSRVVSAKFAWAGHGNWIWRAKLKAWAEKHECRDMDEIAAMFGPHWCYNHREHIEAMEISDFPSGDHVKSYSAELFCEMARSLLCNPKGPVTREPVFLSAVDGGGDARWFIVQPPGSSAVSQSSQAPPEGPSEAREHTPPSSTLPAPSCPDEAAESAPERPADFCGRNQFFTGPSRCAAAQPQSIERDRREGVVGEPPGAIEALATRPVTGITKARAREYVMGPKSAVLARRAKREWITKGQLL